MKLRGFDVEIVEIFDGYVLVEDTSNGSLFVVEFSELKEYNGETVTTPIEKSNIISIEDFKRCQKSPKKKK
jgi:hypothetical protein